MDKALTGGYRAMAATLSNAEVSESVGVLLLGLTFMGNRVYCEVANRSIELLVSSDWENRILQIENILKSELFPLKKQKSVSDVRIIGAIGVIEFKSPLDMKVVQEELIENGVWLRPYGKLLYTMPPYVINDEELLTITKAMSVIAHSY